MHFRVEAEPKQAREFCLEGCSTNLTPIKDWKIFFWIVQIWKQQRQKLSYTLACMRESVIPVLTLWNKLLSCSVV